MSNIIVVETSMSSYEQTFIQNYEIVYYTQKLESKLINEDGIGIFSIPRGVALVVADGVGGSYQSYRAVGQVLNDLNNFFTNYDYENKDTVFADDICKKLQQINTKILNLENTPQTTLSMAVIQSKKITVFQVGDSGTLLTGLKGRLKFMTPFQSLVGEMLLKQEISEKDALVHPELNIVSNVLGHPKFYVTSFLSEEVLKSNKTNKISKYDTLLLATDGLFDNYISEELVDIIRSGSLIETTQILQASVVQNINVINKLKLLKQDDVSFILCRRKPI